MGISEANSRTVASGGQGEWRRTLTNGERLLRSIEVKRDARTGSTKTISPKDEIDCAPLINDTLGHGPESHGRKDNAGLASKWELMETTLGHWANHRWHRTVVRTLPHKRPH